MGWQGATDQVQVGWIGQKHAYTCLVRRLKILGAGLDGGNFSISALGGRFGLDHAHMGKVPRHRARGAQLAFAKQHPHLGRGTVHVVGQAFHHHRHLVGRKAFVNHMLKTHRLPGQARTFFDGAVQRVLGHGDFPRLLHHQAQARVGRGIGAIAGSQHDVFGQFAKGPALGVCGKFFAFCFPLRAHTAFFLLVGAPAGTQVFIWNRDGLYTPRRPLTHPRSSLRAGPRWTAVRTRGRLAGGAHRPTRLAPGTAPRPARRPRRRPPARRAARGSGAA